MRPRTILACSFALGLGWAVATAGLTVEAGEPPGWLGCPDGLVRAQPAYGMMGDAGSHWQTPTGEWFYDAGCTLEDDPDLCMRGPGTDRCGGACPP